MEKFLLISSVGSWLFIALLLILIYRLASMVSDFLMRFRVAEEGKVERVSLKKGNPAPAFHATDESGRSVTLEQIGGSPTMLLFTLDTCYACQQIINFLPELMKAYPRLQILVVSTESEGTEKKQVPAGVRFVRSNELIHRYSIIQYPSFALINPQGMVEEMEHIKSYRFLEDRLEQHLSKAS